MRPTRADIDLGAINQNLRQIRRRIGRKPLIMAVVKANAYGHGIIEVARSVLTSGTAQYLGVAIAEEGIRLRQAGIKAPALVFTAPLPEQLPLFVRHQLEATATNFDTARQLERLAAAGGTIADIHLKVETGMGRIGVRPAEVLSFLDKACGLQHVNIKGIYTHFATSDERDLSYARKQFRTFQQVLASVHDRGYHIPVQHCANSGAILQMKGTELSMVRPGIMMYGYVPSMETRRTIPLKPALSLRSKISFLKLVPGRTSISYGRRYFTKKPTFIATVPIGYADGISRRLTNRLSAIVGGRVLPVVGTICMDQLMIDLGPSTTARIGDIVTLIGREGKHEFTAWDLAETLKTIPYEICCGVTERVPRVYHNG